MPRPTGTKKQRCRMQRALFASDPEYAKKWVEEYGDQCKGGISMAETKTKRNTSKGGKGLLNYR